MQTENRFLDDLARIANGAFNTLSTVREEVETRVRERVERLLADMDLVTREEFEAVRAVAEKARTEQEQLSARVAELERQLAGGAAAGVRAKPAAGEGKARRNTARRRPAKPATEEAAS